MVGEGIPLDGSKFDERIPNIYIENVKSNLTGIPYVSQALGTANLSKTVISNSTLNQLMSPTKQTQFQNPDIHSHNSPAHQPLTMGLTFLPYAV